MKLIEKYDHYPLAQRVVAVAVSNYRENNILFDWGCYIDSVEGRDHSQEFMAVAREGCKLNKNIAKALFPNLDINKYRD